MDISIDEWYRQLTQYAAARGNVVPASADIELLYHKRDLSVEDAYLSLYPPEPVTIEHQTGVEPPREMAELEPMTRQELAEAVAASDAPKVTEADIIARIVKKSYTIMPAGRTVICEITMVNGWTHHGKSTPVSNDDLHIRQAQTRAFMDAIQVAWPMEAYLLRERLYQVELARIANATIGITKQ